LELTWEENLDISLRLNWWKKKKKKPHLLSRRNCRTHSHKKISSRKWRPFNYFSLSWKFDYK